MCEYKDMSMDVATPRNVYLSAFYKRSFAFHTVKNRMPVILTQLVDGLVRRKEEIARDFGSKASEDLKKVIGELSKFRYEVQTNKSLTPLTVDSPDAKIYNDYIAKQANEEGHTTHFNTIWLLSECYMYRRIKEIFQLTETLKDFDYFRNSKEEAYHKGLPLMNQMGEYLVEVLEKDTISQKDAFIALLKANLWGNKCDLSISLGKVDEHSALFDTASMDTNVLCNHSEQIWQAISENSTSDIVVMCECKDMSIDLATPRNVYLSAFYKRSFAFDTVKNQMPAILTQFVDGLARRKEEIARDFGSKASEDLKKAIGELSKLRYEIQTNKSLTPLTVDSPDVKIYNDYIAKQANEDGHTTHFNTIWLLTECYMYRRIKDIFQLTETLKDFDYFRNSKEEAYHKGLPLMNQMGEYLVEVLEKDTISKKDAFIALLKANLWGNKCDLAISLGKVEEHSALFDTASMDPNVLCNHSEQIWQAITENSTSDIIDIILDNSGYELFTDLCIADYLISTKLANHIRIYVKSIPWFISDVMQNDFFWTIEQLQNSDSDVLKKLGNRWAEYAKNGTWVLVVDDFWTLPFEFKFMKSLKPELYRKLSESKAAFFKGDMNYRKLFGEINWDPVTSVEEGLQGFHPTKMCILRTIKADMVVGLKDGVAEKIAKIDPKWMKKGDYGLIQFCGKIVPI